MMTRLGILASALAPALLLACSSPPGPASSPAGAGRPDPAADSPAEELSWMVGTWTTEAKDGEVTIERWRPDEGGGLLGSVETRRGDAITHDETMRIEPRGRALVFVASPSGQATAEFEGSSRCVAPEPAAEACPRRCEAVFENPDHDFPRRISYERCVPGDELIATISGDADQRRATWSYRLVDGTR